MKVEETQEVNDAVAKSETNKLTAREPNSVFVWSPFVCLICGRRETGLELLNCLGGNHGCRCG